MILHKTKNPYPLIPSSFVVGGAFTQGYRKQPCLNPLLHPPDELCYLKNTGEANAMHKI